MKKWIVLLLTLSIAGTALGGCAGDTAESSSASPASSSETSASDGAVSQESAPVQSEAAQDPAAAVDVRALALKGPTAMGMVHFMNGAESGEISDHRYDFSIVGTADEVGPRLIQGEADIAAVPANLASVLFNNTKGAVQVLAINTLGVLYIVESGESITSVEDLRGRTIYASGKGSTPEYALNYVLSQNGIDPASDVTIEWKTEQAECVAALGAQENAIAMLPQPFATTAQAQNANIRVALDLTQEWDKLQEGSVTPSTLVTGVVVARTAFIQENPEAVSAFLDHYKASVEFVNTNVEEAAALVEQYDIVTAEIAQKALPACNIAFIEGAEMREKLSGYLTVLHEQNPQSVGGTLPTEAFYYSR